MHCSSETARGEALAPAHIREPFTSLEIASTLLPAAAVSAQIRVTGPNRWKRPVASDAAGWIPDEYVRRAFTERKEYAEFTAMMDGLREAALSIPSWRARLLSHGSTL
jgi:hypothetical protein